MKTIYVDIVWKPGKVYFGKKVKQIIQNGDIEEVANAMRVLIAKTKAPLFGMTQKELQDDLYFEIYDSLTSETPILRSENAPKRNP